eukprot:11463464-Alexandrium_andersonii.AAC.1
MLQWTDASSRRTVATRPWRSSWSGTAAPGRSWRARCCAKGGCATTRWTKRWRASGGSDAARGFCSRPITSPR